MESASLRYGPAMDSGPFSLSRSFERHLRAKNLSDGTVASYLVGVRQFTAFLRPRGRVLEEATRADLEAFIADLLSRRSPATASTRYKQLQALYRWLEDEEEIAVNPMARMKPPIVPDKPVPVVPEDALRRLLAACAGKSFEARRDTALITFLLDTRAPRRGRRPAAHRLGLRPGRRPGPWQGPSGAGPAIWTHHGGRARPLPQGASSPQGRGAPMVVAGALWPPDGLGTGPDAAAS
jgi:Phage integrase, N-terminal SAM-like domain